MTREDVSSTTVHLLHNAISKMMNVLERWYLRWISTVNVADVRIRGAAIVGISLLNVSIGAIAYKLASGRSWATSFFRVYSVLLDAPNASCLDDTGLAASLVLNVLYIVGLVVFAVLIGMVGEEVAVQVGSWLNSRRITVNARAVCLQAAALCQSPRCTPSPHACRCCC